MGIPARGVDVGAPTDGATVAVATAGDVDDDGAGVILSWGRAVEDEA